MGELSGLSGESGHFLTEQELEFLFPEEVRSNAIGYTQGSPRDDVRFESIKDAVVSTIETGWRFSHIPVGLGEAEYIGLSPFEMTIDYFGGPKDLRLLFDLIKVVGKSKDNLSFELFFNKVLIGLLGEDYPANYDKSRNKFQQTPQLELFQKALQTSPKPLLIIMGHGGSHNKQGGQLEKTVVGQFEI